MNQNYNLRSPAVKRILLEAKEMEQQSNNNEFYAKPLEDNIFEWHFTVRGAADTDFQNGYYHGRILLPNEYPMKPPSIILLTPNGRFELNKKICLSISGHHPETWMPSWSIRTVLLAIISFMPTPAMGHIGSLDYTSDERRLLAKKSQQWKCDLCGPIVNHFKNVNIDDNNGDNIDYKLKIKSTAITTSNDDNDNNIINNSNQQQQNYTNTSTTTTTSSLSSTIIIYYSLVLLIVGLLIRRLFNLCLNQI